MATPKGEGVLCVAPSAPSLAVPLDDEVVSPEGMSTRAVRLAAVEVSSRGRDGGLGVRREKVKGIHASPLPANRKEHDVRTQLPLELVPHLPPGSVGEPGHNLSVAIDGDDGLAVLVDPSGPDPAVVLVRGPRHVRNHVACFLFGHAGRVPPRSRDGFCRRTRACKRECTP